MTDPQYLLDTNVCIDYLTGRYPSVRTRIHASVPAEMCVSSAVVAELRFGAEKSNYRERNHKLLDTFLAEISCRNFDADAARAFGQIRLELERRGQSIGPYDTMIASHAFALGLTLVTDNLREFQCVDGLRLENWRDAT